MDAFVLALSFDERHLSSVKCMNFYSPFAIFYYIFALDFWD